MTRYRTLCCWLGFLLALTCAPPVTSSVDVNMTAVVGKQYCPVEMNCTWTSSDIQETISSVEIQRQSGIAWITVAHCDLVNFTNSIGDTALSATGSAGISITCRQDQMSVAVNSSNTTDSRQLACQVTSVYNVTVSIATLSINASYSACTSCASTGQSCVDGCHGCSSCSNVDCTSACNNVLPLPNVTNVLLGSSVVITCFPSSPSTSTDIVWSRDTDADLIIWMGQNLTIASVLLSSAGTYFCNVTETTCSSQTSTLLQVDWEMPASSSTKTDLAKSVGDSLELMCNVTTSPTPSVVFYFISSQNIANLSSTPININTSVANGQRLASPNQTATGWAELRVTSLNINNTGRYSCVASLPGNMSFLISTYDVSVTDTDGTNSQTTTAPDSGSQSSNSSASQQLFSLWKIGVIVIGVDAFLIFAVVTGVVCKLKQGDKDNETAPLDDEEESGGMNANDFFTEKDDRPLTTAAAGRGRAGADGGEGGRPRNLPDRYYEHDVVDDDISRPRRPASRLPPLERPAQNGYKPNIVVDTYDDDEPPLKPQQQQQPRNGAAAAAGAGRRPRQITASD